VSVNLSKHIQGGDALIITDCRAGRETGWRGLYDAYGGYVFTICRRYGIKEADESDVVQEIFARVFRAFNGFNGETEALKPWLRGIAVNVCLQYFRTRRRGLIDYRDELPISGKSQPNTALNDMAVDDILGLISQLPDLHRCVFNMVIIDGRNYADVAKHLGISEANSRQYLSRARKLLREKISELQKITPLV